MSEEAGKLISPDTTQSASGDGGLKQGLGIAKRKVESDGEDTDSMSDAEEIARRKAHEKRVRTDLSAFLSSKGIDTTRHLGNITIELKVRSEPFNPRKKGPGTAAQPHQGDRYQVVFRLPDGTTCTQKADVYAALQKMPAVKSSVAAAPKVSITAAAKSAISPTAAVGSNASATPRVQSGDHAAISAASGSSAMPAAADSASTTHVAALRKESHEAAMASVAALVANLPCPVGADLVLYALGNLDPRPTFQTTLQLYSMGYRAEISVQDTESNRAFVGIAAGRAPAGSSLPQKFLCFIRAGGQGGTPIFKMTNLATSVSHEAGSEEAVFRMHFPGIEPAGTGISSGADGVGDAKCGGVTGMATGGIGPWPSIAPFSFFNFEVERLLEGLKGTLLCQTYKMHCQRGYPAEYSNAAGAAQAKRVHVISRYNAIKTAPVSTQPPAAAVLQKVADVKDAEMDIGAALRKQASQAASKLTAQSKEAKEKDKEEQKKVAKLQREQAKAQKEEEKKAEAKAKAAAQQRKLQEALDNKYRNAYRADAKKSVGKAQKEAAMAVLDAFDAEESDISTQISTLLAELWGEDNEESDETDEMEALPASPEDDGASARYSALSLADVLSHVAKPCTEGVFGAEGVRHLLPPENHSSVTEEASLLAEALPEHIWDPLLRVANTLMLHKDFLSLQMQPSVDRLAQGLAAQIAQRVACDRALEAQGSTERASAGTSSKFIKLEPVTKTEQSLVAAETIAIAQNALDAKTEGSDRANMDVEGDGVDEDAEAQLDLLPLPSQSVVASDAVIEDPVDVATQLRGQALADIDRVLLCLVQAISAPLHTLLELDDEVAVSSYRNDVANCHAVRLPLNELTYTEIARMALLAHVMPCVQFNANETLAVLRGSSALAGAGTRSSGPLTGYRNNRNTLRHLRYRMLVRHAHLSENAPKALETVLDEKQKQSLAGELEDRLYFLRQHVYVPHKTAADAVNPRVCASLQDPEGPLGTSRLPECDFHDSDDYPKLVAALQAAGSADSGLPEVYQRCARVLLKVCSAACGKHLLWDTSFREYLQVIRFPMTLAVVATRILHMSYGKNATEVANACYTDMRQSALNTLVYYSDAVVTNAMSQKALLVMHRYAYEWLFSARRPPLEACTDGVCMLSRQELQPAATIKCGRCTAPCSLDVLHEASLHSSERLMPTVSKHACLIAPTQELVDKSHEEWMCPLCLEEDSVSCAPLAHAQLIATSQIASSGFVGGNFYVDENGPSATLPWHLNPAYSRSLSRAVELFPTLQTVLWDTLCLLTQPGRTLFQCTRSPRDLADGERIALGLPAQIADSGVTCALSDRGERPWSNSERVRLLVALTELLRGSAANPVGDEAYADAYERTSSPNELCIKLIRLSAQCSPFKETEFLRVVKDVAGEEGMALAREGLDRINAERVNASTDLRELMASAGLADANASTTFSDSAVIDKFRDKDAEDVLLNRYIDLRALEDPSTKNKEKLPPRLNAELLARERACAEVKCQYCGLSELEMCSPLIVGHSPLEHAFHQSRYGDKAAMWANGTLPEDSKGGAFHMRDTRVILRSGQNILSAPPLALPYWPTLDSSHGQQLVEAMGARPGSSRAVDSTKGASSAVAGDMKPTIVHQLCALQMFKARLERRNHDLRRKRRALAQRIVNLTGLYTTCLGYDHEGREYWKFPTAVSSALFICSRLPTDPVKEEFKVALTGRNISHRKSSSTSDSKRTSQQPQHHYHWTMVSDRAGVQEVLAALQRSLNRASDRQSNHRVTILIEELQLLLKNKVAFPEPVTVVAQAPAAAPEVTVITVTDAKSENEEMDVTAEGEVEAVAAVTSDDAEVQVLPDKKVRERREGGGMGSWLVKGGASAADHAQVSFLHGVKKNANSHEANFDQFAYTNPAALAALDLPESQPVELRYLPQKGQTVQEVYVIDEQLGFEEKRSLQPSAEEDGGDNGDEMEDASFEEYFTFNARQRKFIVLSFFNNQDRKVRVPKGAVNLRFEITREGRAEALVTIDLTEMWSDGLYYFSMPNFRRAGKYKFSFTAEVIPEYAGVGKPAVDLRYVKPITFDVTVHARRTLHGAAGAIYKLHARQFINKTGRRTLIDAIRISSYEYIEALRVSCDNGTITECNAVKYALLTVFSALPCGALTLAAEAEIVESGIAHASGWADELESAWFTSLVRARSPLELMECALMLEFYVNKGWLVAPQSRLLTALPSAQFALRCATFASVALRVFSLDKCLNYALVQKELRVARVAKPGNRPSAAVEVASANSRAVSARGTARTEDLDDRYSDAGSDDDQGYRGRSRRAAASAASSRIRKQSDQQRQSQSDDEVAVGPTGGSTSRRSASRRAIQDDDDDGQDETSNGLHAPADSWTCDTCTCRNSLRARSCEACGAKRGGAPASLEGTSLKRGRKSQYDDEEDGDEADGDYDWARFLRESGAGDDVAADSKADVTARQLSILRFLHSDPRSAIFWSPVSQDIEGYHDIITQPMDLGTITKRVTSGHYYADDGQSTTAGLAQAAHEAFRTDVSLVWSNCKKFNGKGPLVSTATALDKLFKDRCTRWITADTRPENPNISE